MKRFTDAKKWDKPWFRTLPPKMKCLWYYILDKCDNAGVIELDIDAASFMIGAQITIDEAEQHLNKQIKRVNGNKWWIVDFIKYQYGSLSESCKPHLQVISLLKNHGLFKEYAKGIYTLKEKDKDKEQDKGKDKDKEKEKEKKHKYGVNKNVLLTDRELERLKKDHTETVTLLAIDYLSNYKIEKGYKTKSDNLTLRRWVFGAVQKNMKPEDLEKMKREVMTKVEGVFGE